MKKENSLKIKDNIFRCCICGKFLAIKDYEITWNSDFSLSYNDMTENISEDTSFIHTKCKDKL